MENIGNFEKKEQFEVSNVAQTEQAKSFDREAAEKNRELAEIIEETGCPKGEGPGIENAQAKGFTKKEIEEQIKGEQNFGTTASE